MIAHLQVLDIGADSLDDTCALVTEHSRCRQRHVAVQGSEVGVADADAGDPDEHLVVLQRGVLCLLQGWSSPCFLEDRYPHGSALLGRYDEVIDPALS